MKHLKLFFALFAMLALGVGNAWGAESLQVTLDFATNSWNLPASKVVEEQSFTSGSYTIKVKGTSGNGYQFNNQKYLIMGKSGATLTLPAFDFNTTKIVVTGKSGASSSVKQNIYVGSNAVSTETTGATGTNTYTINAANQAAGNVYILKVTSAHNTQITKIEVYGESNSTEPPTPATQYTIKWHTAKGVTTDVTLNEGATITKPATDPTMTDYEFMGWTEDCAVASDGADFTAITDFGTATEDKDYYAVFAKATTTGGGGTTTETLKGSDVSYSGTNGYVNFTATTTSGTWSGKANYNKNGYIQINKNNNNYHIGSPTFASNVTSIKITTTNNSAASRTFYICSSNSTAQPSSGDLGSHKTTATNESFTIDLTKEAKQFYIYSSGAVYISQIDVTFAGGTTTYSDYITTCASGIEYVELGDDFKWSATEAEVTIDATDNVFPTLTNTHNVPVIYSSSDETIASIAADGTVTLKKEGSVTITAKYEGGTSAGTGKEYKAKTVDYTLTVKPAPLEPIAGGVIDILDNAWTELTNSDYKTVDAKTAANTGHSNAQYTAQCAGSNSSIQLRSNNSNSGIVSTVSGGLVKRVEIEWNDATSAERTLNIYGSNTPYTNPTDLYDTNKDGDKLGTIVKGTSTHLEISEDYRYIGLRSASGAMYLAKVTITWLPINSKVTVDSEIANGSISVSGAADLNAVAAGTELTLSNTPATGYKLTAYDVYKTDDATTKVTVTDGKFIMPEFDVTISATFEAAKTLNSIEITTPAAQTTFWQTETFNHDGLKVIAHFDGAADEDVTDKVTVNGSTVNAGTVAVEVSFTEGSTTKTTNYDITVKATANGKETAYDVATAREIIDKVSTADNVYVTGIVSEIVTPYNSEYGNISYNISADGLKTSDQLQAFRGKSYNGENFTSADDIQVGDEVVVFGNLLKYSSTYELNADNQLVDLKRDKQQPELSYTTTEYNVNLGDAFTAPTLNNPHSLAVTYSSNDEDVATVAADGAVTIKAAGTVVITASFAGDEDYVAGSASYTINITDPNVSEVTFVAGKDKSDTKSISKNGITVEFADGSFSRDDNYRCYVGQSMTISYADGNITKIVIECTANDGAEYGPGQFTTETATYSYSGKVGTWTGEANSVTFTNIKQVRMTAITVYYKQDNRADAGLAWNPATVSLTVGDAFTAPTFSNPNGLTVSFESSNTDLATVNNAGAISLVSGKTGTATITATYAGNETYKPAEVTCAITVDHKSEDVVILAKCKDQYYAMVAEYVEGKTDVLQALPVAYINGKIYNVATDEQKASITWKRVVVDGKTTFKNGDNYLSAVNSAALKLEEEACDWIFENDMYKIEGADRTILYYATTGGFKNYSIGNMSPDGVAGEYSSNAITVAPIFADGDAYHRTTTPEKFGTICLPFGATSYTGMELYEFVGKEEGKADLASVTTLKAGVPYIFLATANELAVYSDGTTVTEAGSYNGLHGTFTNDTEVAVGNYILKDNKLCQAAEVCYVNANRAYIVWGDIPTGAPQQMPGRKYISMDVQGENETTSVEDLFTTDAPVKVVENAQLIIIRGGEKYNVQGQKL